MPCGSPELPDDEPSHPHPTRPRSALLIMAVVVAALFASPGAAGMKRHEGVERYALKLINCTRTGGWVKTDGSCPAYGSGKHSKYREPLKFHPGIADAVAFPWAKKIARAGYCGHSLAGSDVDAAIPPGRVQERRQR